MRQNKGSPGIRDERGVAARVLAGTGAGDPTAVAGDLPTEAGTEAGAHRRVGEGIRDPEGFRPCCRPVQSKAKPADLQVLQPASHSDSDVSVGYSHLAFRCLGALVSTHAVRRSAQPIASRKETMGLVDVDLERSFVDRVYHDVLMGRLDKVGSRIRRCCGSSRVSYLEAGVMANGVVMEPHGDALRSHRCRRSMNESISWTKWTRSPGATRTRRGPVRRCTAILYVRSRRAGQRVMQALRHVVRETSALRSTRKRAGGASVGSTSLGQLLQGRS